MCLVNALAPIKGERKKENLPVRDIVECATGSGRKHRSESESVTPNANLEEAVSLM